MTQISQEDVDIAYSIKESTPTMRQRVESHYRVVEMVSEEFRIQKRSASAWETLIDLWAYSSPESAFSKMDQLIEEAVITAGDTTVKRVVERPVSEELDRGV